ncbi:MAG: PorV/PorQ family protein [Fidelibacterota bacterium]
MRKLYRTIVLSLVLLSLLPAQYRDIPEVVTKVATTAGNWLKLGTSTRAAGMGGTFVAVGQGVSAIPYNPAAVAYLQGSEVYLSQTNYIADITYNVLSYGKRLSANDYFGINLFYLDSGPIGVTTEDFSNGTGEDYHVISMSFRLAYARRMTDRLKVGITLNYIRDEIYTTNMQSVAFDVGSNFNTGVFGIVLGMSVSNFGPEVQYSGKGLQIPVADSLDVEGRLSKVTESFPLPLMFRLGLQKDIMGPSPEATIKNSTHRLTIALDGTNPTDYTIHGNAGIEYSFKEMAFIRAGANIGHDTAGFAAGGGLLIKLGRLSARVDYALVDYNILKLMHQVSIGLEF